jgi:hypothetical protein
MKIIYKGAYPEWRMAHCYFMYNIVMPTPEPEWWKPCAWAGQVHKAGLFMSREVIVGLLQVDMCVLGILYMLR